MGGKLTIGALSRRTGVPVKTLRFYSDEGLLPPLERSRLVAVESHIAGLQRIAAALRAAIAGGPTAAHLRRITTATRISNEERKRAHLTVKYEPRGARYGELVSIMRGGTEPPQRFDDWRWLGEALRHHTAS